MSATSLQAYPVIVPNPDVPDKNGPARINDADGTFLSNSLRTLSANNVSPNSEIVGLLYVPDLNASSLCVNASAPYVPANATRWANLPSTAQQDFIVAIAPWLSPVCTKEYLAAASAQVPNGFVFFLPDNGTAQPPAATNVTWDLGDNGAWKDENQYPVYAVPGQIGSSLMSDITAYSGNITNVPNGHNLTEQGVDPRSFVRVLVNINTAAGAGELPSLWVFLLIVLGILLAIIGLTSLLMHLLQRRRRRSLRRRVADGEVDLEVLGIKRLTVPQDLLDRMPLYTYGTGAPVNASAADDTLPSTKGDAVDANRYMPAPKSRTRPAAAPLDESTYHPSPLQQPTCAICLDDFVPGSADSDGTIIRELPCHHIFHPECIDTFLRDSSSLCPICKRTALPKGYCPRVVTNAMVRRERAMNRIRQRMSTSDASAPLPDTAVDDHRSYLPGLASRVRTRTSSGISRLLRGHGASSAPVPSTLSVMTEMTTSPMGIDPTLSNTTSPSRTRIQPPSNPTRREWARQRAVALLGRDVAPVDPEADDARNTPVWRKAVRGLFPIGR